MNYFKRITCKKNFWKLFIVSWGFFLIGKLDLSAINLLHKSVIERDYETVEGILSGKFLNSTLTINKKGLERIMNYKDFLSHRSKKEIQDLLNNVFEKYDIPYIDLWSPLNWAIFNNDLRMVKLLLEYDANLNTFDSIKATPLHWAALWASIGIIRELIFHGSKINLKDKEGFTPLYRAIQRRSDKRDIDLLKFFIAQGSKITHTDKKGRNAFHIAATMNYPDAIFYFRSINPKLINSLDYYGNNALHWAITSKPDPNNLLVIKILLQVGLYVDNKNKNGLTPFHVAVIRRNNKAVKFLLEYSVDPNLQTESGDTPLHLAARWGYDDTIRIFYNFQTSGLKLFSSRKIQVNPQIKNYQGIPPLNVALYNEHVFAALEILKFVNTNPLQYDKNGETGMHIAAQSHSLKLMNNMITRARTFNEKEMFLLENHKGQRPIEVAVESGDVEMVIFLIKNGGLLSIKPININRLLPYVKTVEMGKLILKLKKNPQAFVFK